MGRHAFLGCSVTLLCLFTLVLGGAPDLSAEDKLPYGARQAVQRQESNVVKAEKQLEVLKKQAEWKAYPNKVQPGLGVTQLLDSIESDLSKNGAPPEHSKVKPMLDRVKAIREALPALEATLTEKHAKWNELADIKNYPHFDKDLERIKGLYERYKAGADAAKRAGPSRSRSRGDMVMAVQPMQGIDAFVEASTNYTEDADYFNGVVQRYQVLMKVNAGAKSRIMAQAKPAAKYMNEFHGAREKAVSFFPENVRLNLKAASSMAAKASADKNPMFFKGGVAQAMGFASTSLETLRTVKGPEDAEVQALDKEFAAAKAEVDKVESELAAQILADARVPKDLYAGGDRDDLLGRVRKAWMEKYPDDEILLIVIPKAEWERHTAWKSNAVEWYYVDHSELLANIVIKQDDVVAEVFPAYFNKDHRKNDLLTCGVHTKFGGYSSRKVLLANMP